MAAKTYLVHVGQFGQILHSICDSTQHGDQLQAGESVLVGLFVCRVVGC